jgi:hypothetical protein
MWQSNATLEPDSPARMGACAGEHEIGWSRQGLNHIQQHAREYCQRQAYITQLLQGIMETNTLCDNGEPTWITLSMKNIVRHHYQGFPAL